MVEALERVEVPYLVVGSTAAAAWGVARMTRYVDIVARISVDDVQALLAALAGGDLYVDAGEAADAVVEGGSFNVIHPASGGKVDVFVAPSTDDFTRSRLARRTRATVLGVPTWVATAEDVVLAKLRWRLETRSETQWRDCVEIAGSQDLDGGYLWQWASSLGVEEDLGELLALIDRPVMRPNEPLRWREARANQQETQGSLLTKTPLTAEHLRFSDHRRHAWGRDWSWESTSTAHPNVALPSEMGRATLSMEGGSPVKPVRLHIS